MSHFFTHQEFEVDICICFIADFDEASRDVISSKYSEQDFVVHCIKVYLSQLTEKKTLCFLRVCKGSWHPM
jgi:hypothetical protein